MGIRRAIISLSDKAGIQDFAKVLYEKWGVEILSTGGTARILTESGIPVVEVSSYTGFPEMMDGRVKTLHPKIHGGILALRDNSEHRDAMEREGIKPIDMVVVNLYPFKKVIERPDCTLSEAIENIDIGGPTLIRAAAKNYPFVTVIVDPSDYGRVLEEMEANNGNTTLLTRFKLAVKVFDHTSNYDATITSYLKGMKDKV